MEYVSGDWGKEKRSNEEQFHRKTRVGTLNFSLENPTSSTTIRNVRVRK